MTEENVPEVANAENGVWIASLGQEAGECTAGAFPIRLRSLRPANGHPIDLSFRIQTKRSTGSTKNLGLHFQPFSLPAFQPFPAPNN